MTARELALQVLLNVHERGAYANVALVQALRRHQLDDAERKLATELVYGVAKAGDSLDWLLQQYLSRPLTKVAPPIREALRLGLFQLRQLDKIPASAAVNESVKLAKRYGHLGTAKFVNAVLRTAAREPHCADDKLAQLQRDDHAQWLALTAQHPLWLVRRWLAQFGRDDTARLCAFDNEPPTLAVRTNTLRTDRESLLQRLRDDGLAAHPSPWTPEGIVLAQTRGSLDDLAPLRDGLCQVQGESSQQVARLLDPHPGEFVLDACAAPGGKTTHLAQLMGDRGRVLACDIYEAKLRRVNDNARRLGLAIIEAVNLDARLLGQRYRGQADRLLIDAPCSGLGVLRRRPDARWRKSADEIAALAVLQGEILDGAVDALKPGGVLVYSTCTLTAEENDDAVRAFLARRRDFALERAAQLLPQRDGIDGFFLARLRRAAT